MTRVLVRAGIAVSLVMVATMLVVSEAPSTAVATTEGCLALAEPIGQGEVTTSDWDEWTGVDVDFGSNKEHLEVLASSQHGLVLRQQLVPTSQGSDRVTMKAPIEAAQTFRLSQRVFLEPGFDWGREKQGGKLGFGLGGGSTPTGGDLDYDGFTARFMWRGNGDGTARIVLYSYAADRTQNLPYGDDYELTGFEAPIGEWFTLAMDVTANSSVNSSNGSVQAFVNGELALDRGGIRWQSEGAAPRVDHLLYSTFHGGNGWEWAPKRTNHVRFDDVCWGPVGQPDAPQPDAPQPSEGRRGRIAAIGTQLDSLLPSGSGQIDYRINAAIDHLDAALVPSLWSGLWLLTPESDSMRSLDRALSKLQSAKESSQATSAMRKAIDLQMTALAGEAMGIANGAIKKPRARIQWLDCSCSQARRLLTAAVTELAAARSARRANGDPVEQFDLARDAWDNAQYALAALP